MIHPMEVRDTRLARTAHFSIETALRELLCAVEPATHGSAAETQYRSLDVQLDGIAYTIEISWADTAPERVTLSPREREIARLIARGLPNKAIAHALNISPYTVGTYTKRIFCKLNVNSRAEMVAKVLSKNLLTE